MVLKYYCLTAAASMWQHGFFENREPDINATPARGSSRSYDLFTTVPADRWILDPRTELLLGSYWRHNETTARWACIICNACLCRWTDAAVGR